MSVVLQQRDLPRGQVRVDIRIEADLNIGEGGGMAILTMRKRCPCS